MRLESLEFTHEQLEEFRLDLFAHDRDVLVERLRAASERMRVLAQRIPDEPASVVHDDWTAREVLAHMAVLSKFYGVAAKKVAGGEWGDFDLLGHVSQRDVAGEQVAKLSPAQIVDIAFADHRRTIEFLRAADPATLARRVKVAEGITMSAEELCRLGVCAHLELHLEQLERVLDEDARG
jgi:hypothetical protein